MNKSRRNQLEDLLASLRNCISELQSIYEDERDALERMPENLQNSERYQQMDETVDVLETEMYNLDDIISHLENIIKKNYTEFKKNHLTDFLLYGIIWIEIQR